MGYLSILLLGFLPMVTALAIFCLLMEELEKVRPVMRWVAPVGIYAFCAMPAFLLLGYGYTRYGVMLLTSFVMYSLGLLVLTLPQVYPKVRRGVQALGQVRRGSWYLEVLGAGLLFQSLLGMSLMGVLEPRLLVIGSFGFLFFFFGYILSRAGKIPPS